jgi:hypothetical protein
MHIDKQFQKLISEVKRLALSGVELLPHVIGIAQDGRILEVICIGGDKADFFGAVADFFKACDIQKYYFISEFNTIDAVPRIDGILICQATRNTSLMMTSAIQYEPDGHRRLVDTQFSKNTSGNIAELLHDTKNQLPEDRKISIQELLIASRRPDGIILWPPNRHERQMPHQKQVLLGNIFRLRKDNSNVPSADDIVRPNRDPKPNDRFENTILLAKSLLFSTGELVPTTIGFRTDGSAIQLHLSMDSVGLENLPDFFAANNVTEIHVFHRFIASSGIAWNIVAKGIPDPKTAKGPECLVVIAVTPDYKWRWNCRIIRDEKGAVECLSNFAWDESSDLFIFEGIFPEKDNQMPEERRKAIMECFAPRISNTYETELSTMKEFVDSKLEHMHVLTATSEFAIRKMHGLDTAIPVADPEAEWGRVRFPDGRIAYLGMRETGSYYRFSPNAQREAFAAEKGPGLFAIFLDIKGMAVARSAVAPRSAIYEHAEYRDFGFGPQLSIDCAAPGIKFLTPNNIISNDQTA